MNTTVKKASEVTFNLEPEFPSVYAAFEASARRNLAKIALVFEGTSITYADLIERIENTVRHLRSRGIGKGDAFAAFSQNRPEQLYCYYAAAKIGAVFVPVNPNLTPSEVEYTVAHSEAKLLFHDEVVAETAKAAVSNALLVPMEELATQLPVRLLDSAVVTPQDDFLVIYTSGTTGAPKAIILNHAAQMDGPAALARMFGITSDDITLVALPLGYLYGLSTAAATSLQAGGTVVILRRFHPRDVLAALVENKATVYHGVPTMFSMMMEYCEQRSLTFDLSQMRKLICAGAPLTSEVEKRFVSQFGKELENYYALTECTPVFGRYFDDPTPLPEGSIGRAAPGATVKILRADGNECGPNEDGELFVRAAATLDRYLKNPSMTDEALSDGLFKTGDLVRRDENGFFYITGRIKEIIIRGGANISPAEVEKALISHSGVQDAAVIGVADKIFGEVPVAVVVRRHGSEVSQEELISHVEGLLSDFKVPRTIVFETELPQGKTGKTDKKALKERVEGLLANR
ncbi:MULTISPECIES: class I adenylate-forming enzyme family protein [unclassified Rhizobium]|uniref:class I adenylate-forming enzyme family protein n=1 Tax=unclassified Rhizobium TaxID=2613769 RepID=UPI00070222E9|nr:MULTISPECIES: class I adenylate-forming enzyme family protein [unclassified Rhizobium]KQV39368.1 AMP-dependent synthetase [Rhizobium sp. Root1212]KRD35373.1 AMP-dependent synthetase [Rhizobium sp. Root268]